MDLYLFLPQMRMPMEAIVARARTAETAGFTGIAFMDHLTPPLAEDQPGYDAMVSAAWVASATTRLRVGHLVLCDAFRHPAMLAKQAATLDDASGGRFDLGIGWGSVPSEFAPFGIGTTEPRARVERLAETLEVLELLWSGETVSYDGRYHQLDGAVMRPAPGGRIPIVIGGVGKRTLQLVRAHADWWNVPVHRLGAIERLRVDAGDARVSVQLMVAFVPPGSDAATVEATARRRFGGTASIGGMVIGDTASVVDQFGQLAERGVERIYAWFTDFAPVPTLEAFAEVIGEVRPGGERQ